MEGKDLSNVEVLEYYGVLYPPDGPGWKSLRCPFHEDNNASASSNGKGFVCFACGVRGGPISLIMGREDIDYQSAVERYEEISGREFTALRKRTNKSRTRVNLSGEARSYERDNPFFSSRGSRESSTRIRPRFYDG